MRDGVWGMVPVLASRRSESMKIIKSTQLHVLSYLKLTKGSRLLLNAAQHRVLDVLRLQHSRIPHRRIIQPIRYRVVLRRGAEVSDMFKI
jgi:hypothetical protein